MSITKEELLLENKRLESTVDIIRNEISSLSTDLYDKETKLREFQRMMWDNKAELDPAEMKTLRTSNDMEVFFLEQKAKKFKKMYQIQNKPYFGRIDFKSNEGNHEVYIGITNVEKDLNYYVYDWRSPICSMFYDFGVEDAYYMAPEGKIEGTITLKRQYQIKDAKLDNVFDTTINIDDDVLQSVLKENSSDHMKNIVNTIQKEQNEVIRDEKTNNLIVQGIAGSGKTSVALHRIAYLLYKIENLNSNNVLIFSPNNIFGEYISNVLPELGEDNTLITTFHEFASKYIKEYWRVEPYSEFLARYYQNNYQDNDLIKFKLSDEVIPIIENYASTITRLCKFKNDISYKEVIIDKNELNELLSNRFSKFNLFNRFDYIAEKINNRYFNGKKQDQVRIKALLLKNINITTNIKDIYKDFFDSQEFLNAYNKHFNRNENIKNLNKKVLNYEDSSLFIYLKFLLMDIPYKVSTKLVVIDEAQDYTLIQYKIIKKLFRNANFTILGDINQTINPYYKYDNLNILSNEFDGISKYIELSKTYRSSKEIIEYSNKILGLNHVCAVRRENNTPVKIHDKFDIELLLKEIDYLKNKYSSLAIITKSIEEAEYLKNIIKDIEIVDNNTENFNRNLLIIPAYAAKGLEFDSVIILNNFINEKYLYYVAITRAQHELIIFNSTK
ncbi:MAG: AAA family ATPase [Bacilli bacterium]|nr:AAA family ATPase [Bacilli bacterium]